MKLDASYILLHEDRRIETQRGLAELAHDIDQFTDYHRAKAMALAFWLHLKQGDLHRSVRKHALATEGSNVSFGVAEEGDATFAGLQGDAAVERPEDIAVEVPSDDD